MPKTFQTDLADPLHNEMKSIFESLCQNKE